MMWKNKHFLFLGGWGGWWWLGGGVTAGRMELQDGQAFVLMECD